MIHREYSQDIAKPIDLYAMARVRLVNIVLDEFNALLRLGRVVLLGLDLEFGYVEDGTVILKDEVEQGRKAR